MNAESESSRNGDVNGVVANASSDFDVACIEAAEC